MGALLWFFLWSLRVSSCRAAGEASPSVTSHQRGRAATRVTGTGSLGPSVHDRMGASGWKCHPRGTPPCLILAPESALGEYSPLVKAPGPAHSCQPCLAPMGAARNLQELEQMGHRGQQGHGEHQGIPGTCITATSAFCALQHPQHLRGARDRTPAPAGRRRARWHAGTSPVATTRCSPPRIITLNTEAIHSAAVTGAACWSRLRCCFSPTHIITASTWQQLASSAEEASYCFTAGARSCRREGSGAKCKLGAAACQTPSTEAR